MRLVFILSISLFALGACDSPDITGTEDPTSANFDAPEKPELCRPACEVLTDTCRVADDDGDVEILRGCIEGCLQGDIEDAELECLAVADCTTASECFE